MGTELKNFTASGGWTSTCSVVGSDSSDPTGSFFWTKAKFDAVYPTLALGGTFTDGAALALNVNAKILFTNGGVHITNAGFDNLVTVSDQGIVWGSGGVGINKVSSGVLEVNNGTPGTLADLQARNIPFILKLAGVDLTAAATTDIFTVPAGKRLVVTAAQVVFTTVTALTVGATVGILDSGTAATILGNQTIANTVTAAQSTYFAAPSFAKQNVTAGNKLQFIVSINGSATAWVADVYVHCYYAY